MEITEVRIHLRNEEKLKAYATITIDKCFVVRDLKIIQGNTGMFVAMPSRKKPDGSFKDIAHPLDNDTRKLLETKILEAYKEELLKLKDQVNKVDEASVVKAVEVQTPVSVPVPAPIPEVSQVSMPVPTPVPAPAQPQSNSPAPSRSHQREPGRKMTMEEWEKSLEGK